MALGGVIPGYVLAWVGFNSQSGTLDIERYARLASDQDPDMPMIIEHLTTDSEYCDSVKYVRRRLTLQNED